MAVQKSKKSRAARGTRRAHDGLGEATLSLDPKSGRLHRRHHMTQDAHYRGRPIKVPNLVLGDAPAASES